MSQSAGSLLVTLKIVSYPATCQCVPHWR